MSTDPVDLPASVQHWIAQAITAMQHGRSAQAASCLQNAVALQPPSPTAWHMLGDVLLHRGERTGAVAAYQHAIALHPDPHASLNLGSALTGLDRSDEAIDAMQTAVAQAPTWAEARRGLASAYFASGQLGPAIEQLQTALQLDPSNDVAHSLLLYAMLFQGRTPPLQLRAAHEQWAAQHTANVQRLPTPPNDRTPDRRLKIGYVSPNFCNHAVAQFLPPILEHHDPWEVEVFCYADVPVPDATTARLRKHPDIWRETAGLSHAQLAEQIRRDQIDLLVDLTGHLPGGRLQTFAAKPAPIQITYLGYQATTGVPEIDYVLTDAWNDPPGETEAFWVEQPWRLPGAFFCYEPHRAVAPAVGPLPALASGRVTFGCLNAVVKITPRTLDVWCAVLREVHDSRITLLAPRGERTAARLRAGFTSRGIDGDRVELINRSAVPAYLGRYNAIDLCLDPVPFTGHTTTCDAAWMGVPTVSVAGDSFVTRYGCGVMRNLDLADLITTTDAEFVATAVGLARDLPRLARLRGTLRERMNRSIVTDGARFTRNLETAYRAMWGLWCARE